MSDSLNSTPISPPPAGNTPPVVDDDHGPCLYSDYQVGFLCHIGHLFEDALYTEQTECFMQELFALWFRDWPEVPEDVERRKNSLRRAMLAVSHERTPDLTFIDQGITPHFTPVPTDNTDAATTSTAGATSSAASASQPAQNT
ncbi:hypothetical protein EV421DRAFT_1906643 [Armillaria borealis]|uniref:Uncharacterized protein n=1 Tax=Armillaria borealis TaxID=47425 RepID=A0AA39JBQ9_9AGAR|nr:hypothetical protein EV421DRAFT_1738445 [Armillaria borealis]KAK0438399.1 hypothetical protein EV421DRAFT_1906643 [Armillaria borealis]